MDQYLSPTPFIDSDQTQILAAARQIVAGVEDDLPRAVKLYYAVRDGVRYDPYVDFADPDTYKASLVLEAGRGFCIPKACLLAALARAVGIPSRLGFGDVRNHLASPRLLELNGGDVMHWHGYTDLWLEGRWVKATPAFNLSLCERFRVIPLEFDGRDDSLFQPFDLDQRKHMEYVRYRDTYADLPLEEILTTLRQTSPKMFSGSGARGGDFYAEAAGPHSST